MQAHGTSTLQGQTHPTHKERAPGLRQPYRVRSVHFIGSAPHAARLSGSRSRALQVARRLPLLLCLVLAEILELDLTSLSSLRRRIASALAPGATRSTRSGPPTPDSAARTSPHTLHATLLSCYETGSLPSPPRTLPLYAALLIGTDCTGSPMIRDSTRSSRTNGARSSGSSALSKSPRLGAQCFSTQAWPSFLNSAGMLISVRLIALRAHWYREPESGEYEPLPRPAAPRQIAIMSCPSAPRWRVDSPRCHAE